MRVTSKLREHFNAGSSATDPAVTGKATVITPSQSQPCRLAEITPPPMFEALNLTHCFINKFVYF